MHVTLHVVSCMHEHVIGLSMFARGLNRYTCMFLGCHFVVQSFFEALRLCIVW